MRFHKINKHITKFMNINMCGIIGIVSDKKLSVKNDLLFALKKLEYRGYDSVGFALDDGTVKKDTSTIDSLRDSAKNMDFFAGISHTRWATHGNVNSINAHPHCNKDKTIFAVHNGIIENYVELKNSLAQEGYEFLTQTDSEIIPHYFDFKLKKKDDMKLAIQDFFREAKGTFAIVIIRKGIKTLYALKKDSPLAFGINSSTAYLASDIYGFSEKTSEAIFFEDYDYAEISPNSYKFYNNNKEIKKTFTKFEWTRQEETKKEFKHFMIKEVYEQPQTAKNLIESFSLKQKNVLEKTVSMIKKSSNIVFVSCGTSYHASLIGALLLRKIGLQAHTVIASEFENFIKVGKDTLVIALSQSGETMDVVTVLKDAKKQGAKIASIVNVPYSTIQRLSDVSIELLAGQEICVAATKSFTNQVITLLAIAKELGADFDLESIPEKIKSVIDENDKKVQSLAKKLYKINDIFVLGRGLSYPIAREIALKLKEISYVHAEGMMGGELKHGTIALVEKATPVISLVFNNDLDMQSNAKEVEARGADVITISDTDGLGEFKIPKCQNGEFAIYACMIGHLLSYYIAVHRKLPIDKPRNLAKSVTVK